MLHGLRIPIIRLYGNLIVPIQVALSDDLVKQLKDDVTLAIERLSPSGLVIDVSGIGVMDTFITRTIRDVALVARLMGTKTVISGLDPMIAITLVEMDMDLKGVDTALDLEAAIESLKVTRKTDSSILDELLATQAEEQAGG